jgi:hypothetical protein
MARIGPSSVNWAQLRRALWQPPRPHGQQPRQRTVGPLELFYDLAVVVLVAQVAHSNPATSPAPRRTISGSGIEKSITVVGSVPQSPQSITASTACSS